MSTTPTTVAIFLLGSAILASPGTPTASWLQALSTLKSVPGVTDVAWGLMVEDRQHLVLLIDWTDLTARDAAQAQISGTLSPFLSPARPPLLFTAHMDGASTPPGSTDIRAAPVAEMVLNFFAVAEGSSGPSAERRAEVTAESAAFAGRLCGDLPTVLSFSSGWQSPEEPPVAVRAVSGMRDGERAVVFVKFLGWPSAEEHSKAFRTPAFQRQLPNLRNGAEGGDMKHVRFTRV